MNKLEMIRKMRSHYYDVGLENPEDAADAYADEAVEYLINSSEEEVRTAYEKLLEECCVGLEHE